MISGIKIQLNAFRLTVLTPGKISISIFVAYYAHIELKRTKNIFQVLFS